jgi:purine catabolism regulator
VVILAGSEAHHKQLVSSSLPQTLEHAVTAVVGKDLVTVVADDGRGATAMARSLSDHLAEAGIHATIGIGGAYTKPNGLRWSYFEARDAASHGLPVNEPERLSLTSLLRRARTCRWRTWPTSHWTRSAASMPPMAPS